MTVQRKIHYLPPTALIPNSPYPLIHYPGFLSADQVADPVHAHELFARNGWHTQWMYRYGSTQPSHYHSGTHECMAVLRGEATIRFGVADTTDDLDVSTHGSGQEEGGIEIAAAPGDIFVIPAGVAHKTYRPFPDSNLASLTRSDSRAVDSAELRSVVGSGQLSGFVMIGAYPQGSKWDFAVGGESHGAFDAVWAVPKPENDPAVGRAAEGLCGLWE